MLESRLEVNEQFRRRVRVLHPLRHVQVNPTERINQFPSTIQGHQQIPINRHIQQPRDSIGHALRAVNRQRSIDLVAAGESRRVLRVPRHVQEFQRPLFRVELRHDHRVGQAGEVLFGALMVAGIIVTHARDENCDWRFWRNRQRRKPRDERQCGREEDGEASDQQ